MKRTVIFLIIAAILLLCGCVNDTVGAGGVVIRGASPTEPQVKISMPPNEDIVYVTATGTKYHAADCPSLGDSSIPITLEQALQEGKQPCSRCH